MRNAVRLTLLLCFLVLLTPLLLSPQTPAPQAPAVFRSRADLVLVPVHVRRKGDHVAGLDRDSFTVLQDGQPQKLAVFEEVRTTTERLKRVALPRGEFTNEIAGNVNTARYTVIAIDRINTGTMDMHRLRDGLMKFLTAATDSGEPIRLIAINASNVQLIQDFTTDPKVLAAALQRTQTAAGQVRGGDAALDEHNQYMAIEASLIGENNPDQMAVMLNGLEDQKQIEQQQVTFRDRTSRINSLEALQEVALSLSGLPGRKSLVWASSGYAFASLFTQTTTGVKFSPGSVLEAVGLDEYTMHLLNTANIALYPIDARGTVNTAFEVMDTSRKLSPTYAQKEYATARNQDIITTFENLAGSTGGKACYERTDLSGCFKDAMDDARDYYLLGYYINRDKLKPGWRKISVKVEEKGVSVRARNGFLLAKFTPEETGSLELHTDIGSRLVDPGLPFRGRWTGNTPKADKKAVGFELSIPPSAGVISLEDKRFSVDIAGLARRPDGTVAAQFAQHIARNLTPEAVEAIQRSGIAYKNVFELPAGMYLVRFVIRDSLHARTGAVSTVLTVP